MHDRNRDSDDGDQAEFNRLLYDAVPGPSAAESSAIFAATMQQMQVDDESSDALGGDGYDDAAFAEPAPTDFGMTDSGMTDFASAEFDDGPFRFFDAAPGEPDHGPAADHDVSGGI